MSNALDERIRQLLREIDEVAPAPQPWERITRNPSARPVRWLVPAVAMSLVVVIGLIVAVVLLPGDDGSRVVTVPPVSTGPDVTSTPSMAPAPTPPTTRQPAGLQLIVPPEQAAEIAARGNDDARSLFDAVPVEATYEVIACPPDGSACQSPPDPSRPRVVQDPIPLAYLDVATLREILGVGAEDARGDPNEWLGPDVLVPPINMPRFFGSIGDDPVAARADVGFALGDIQRMVSGRGAPTENAVLDVAVSPSVIDTAVRSDPTWSPRLRIVEEAGTTFYDWTQGDDYFAQDLTRTSPIRPLGVGGQLHVEPHGDGARVTRTLDPAVMRAALADSGGSALSAGPYAPGLTMALLPDARLLQLTALPAAMHPVRQDGNGPAVSGMLTKVVAVSIDADGLRTDTYVVFRDETAASENLDAIITLARAESPNDQAGWADNTSPDAHVEQVGSVVHVTIRGFNGGVPTPRSE